MKGLLHKHKQEMNKGYAVFMSNTVMAIRLY